AAVDGAALLATVAQRTGGQVVTGPEYQPPASGQRSSLWPFAVGAGLLLFLGELAWRRLGRAAAAACSDTVHSSSSSRSSCSWAGEVSTPLPWFSASPAQALGASTSTFMISRSTAVA